MVVGLPGSPESSSRVAVCISESSTIKDVQLNSNSEVGLLADFLSCRGWALYELVLEGLVTVISDDMAGLLDPIILAMTASSNGGAFLPVTFELIGSDGVLASGVVGLGLGEPRQTHCWAHTDG
jgi:hypothetical protein